MGDFMPKIKIDYSFSNIDLNINYEIEGICYSKIIVMNHKVGEL